MFGRFAAPFGKHARRDPLCGLLHLNEIEALPIVGKLPHMPGAKKMEFHRFSLK
jgi:hypothetical protein